MTKRKDRTPRTCEYVKPTLAMLAQDVDVLVGKGVSFVVAMQRVAAKWGLDDDQYRRMKEEYDLLVDGLDGG